MIIEICNQIQLISILRLSVEKDVKPLEEKASVFENVWE